MGGYRVLSVHPGSAAAERGIEPFFDFITAVKSLPVSASESFAEIIAAATGAPVGEKLPGGNLLGEKGEDPFPVELTIYNRRRRAVQIWPVQPNKPIGLVLRFETFEAADVFPTLEVVAFHGDSLGAKAGLRLKDRILSLGVNGLPATFDAVSHILRQPAIHALGDSHGTTGDQRGDMADQIASGEAEVDCGADQEDEDIVIPLSILRQETRTSEALDFSPVLSPASRCAPSSASLEAGDFQRCGPEPQHRLSRSSENLSSAPLQGRRKSVVAESIALEVRTLHLRVPKLLHKRGAPASLQITPSLGLQLQLDLTSLAQLEDELLHETTSSENVQSAEVAARAALAEKGEWETESLVEANGLEVIDEASAGAVTSADALALVPPMQNRTRSVSDQLAGLPAAGLQSITTPSQGRLLDSEKPKHSLLDTISSRDEEKVMRVPVHYREFYVQPYTTASTKVSVGTK